MRTLCILTALWMGGWLAAQTPVEPPLDVSIAMEATLGLRRAAGALVATQAADGSWSQHPGITAVGLLALRLSPDGAGEVVQGTLARAADYLVAQVRPDGSIARVPGDTDVYSTSVVLMALVALDREVDREVVARLRQRLIDAQLPAGQGYNATGFRYRTATYPDLSNTHWALEALHVAGEPRAAEAVQRRQLRRLWHVAIHLIARCQMMPGERREIAADDRGGFTYYPLDAELVDARHADELAAARVWGSLTCGAVKSLVYAGVKPDDPRVVAGRAWLARHYTVQHNPGLDQGGIYYYTYMLTTAHLLFGERFVTTPDGVRHNWRRDVANYLLARQGADGQWRNANPLWMENDATLCTAYAMLALEIAIGPAP